MNTATEDSTVSEERKHTPGPWYVSGQWPHKTEVSNGDGTVCTCDEGDDGFDHGANAQLIAAAPDMAELLLELIDLEGPQPGNVTWANKVKAVLAKAGAL